MSFDTSKTYAYYDASNLRVYVEGIEVSYRGTWLIITSYVPGDVVVHSGAFYYCLTSNTGYTPDGLRTGYWTPLVEVYEESGTASVTTNGSDAYARDLALSALTAASSAVLTANAAMAMAQSGTTFLATGTIGVPVVSTNFFGSVALFTGGTSGTLYFDFTGPATQSHVISGDVWVATRNWRRGSHVTALLEPDGVTHNVGYVSTPAIKWFGTVAPTSMSLYTIKLDVHCINDSPAVVYGVPYVAVST